MGGSRFWDGVPGRARRALTEAGTGVLIKPSAFLVRQHTRSPQVFVIHEGAAKVWADGDGEIAILDVLGPGDIVGELEAADGGPRQAYVQAMTPVRALVLPAPLFRSVLEEHPAAVWAVAAVLAERLRDADELRVAHFPDVPERRLAGRLLRLAERFGAPDGDGGIRVDVPVSQQDLARWAGMGRRKVAQILAGLDEVTLTRKGMTLRSVEALEALARG
ncbi:Crp/Fnr family transcriptional regulator [Spirillospora sp. CA-294931]|uniref:Crp/Fnr family transcriptional regulator n=1 Tax=Spirillospora sp. CA-294931 TaxID=3240042 RepID=UPI003D89DDD8